MGSRRHDEVDAFVVPVLEASPLERRPTGEPCSETGVKHCGPTRLPTSQRGSRGGDHFGPVELPLASGHTTTHGVRREPDLDKLPSGDDLVLSESQLIEREVVPLQCGSR